jgi:hypothetical protein
MLLNMVQHPSLRGFLATKIKRHAIKAAIEAAQIPGLSAVKSFFDCRDKVKSSSFPLHPHVSIPSHICPYGTCV